MMLKRRIFIKITKINIKKNSKSNIKIIFIFIINKKDCIKLNCLNKNKLIIYIVVIIIKNDSIL